MSSDVVFQVRNVSKVFEMYSRPVHRLFQTLFAGHKRFYQEFRALNDISFDIRRGESVGIIGKNGAGKSTLLQILVGTLLPTTGSVHSTGRVAALLELGSGFNPEFTGRENVLMNAAVLGLSREQVMEKFEEIQAFADIGNFIDQPVKTYSSGMMVRLAFAVQIMVKPDILIVDEALAVGDAAFQRKCYARLDALLAQGMTLLLVTHDTETVKQKCNRVLFLKEGNLCYDGPAEEGVVEYMRYLFPQEEDHVQSSPNAAASGEERKTAGPEEKFVYELLDENLHKNKWGIGGGRFHKLALHGLEPPNLLRTPCRFTIELEASWDSSKVHELIQKESLENNIMVGIRIVDTRNIVLFGTNTFLENKRISPDLQHATVYFTIDFPMLKNGDLFLTFALSVGNMISHTHLVWDDLIIQLKSISPSLSDGMVHFHTETTIVEGAK